MLSLYVISTAATITQICEELLPRIEDLFKFPQQRWLEIRVAIPRVSIPSSIKRFYLSN